MPKRKRIFILFCLTLFGGNLPGMAQERVAVPDLENRVGVSEIVSERNAHTRVYENIYAVPILDEEGNPTGETREIRKRYYQKGSGINYRDGVDAQGRPVWLPTDTTVRPSSRPGFAYQVETGPAKVYFTEDVQDRYNLHYRVEGETLESGVAGLAWYDRSSGETRVFDSPRSSTPVLEGNRILYPDVFSGADLEYVYENAAFHTNLILNDRSGLPSPVQFGMDPASTYLLVSFRLDLDGYSRDLQHGTTRLASLSNYEGDNLRLDFKDAEGRTPHYLDRGRAWDSSSGESNGVPVFKRVIRDEAEIFLQEGVPYSWVMSRDRTLPIVIDPVQVPTGSEVTTREVWKKGTTYQVTGPIWFSEIGTLTGALVVEGGAVIKLGDPGETNHQDSQIRINDQATFRSQGSPGNYAIFTSVNDNSVGESIVGSSGAPQRGDYGSPVFLVEANSLDHRLQYMKISYAYNGLFLMDVSLTGKVENNIIRSCYNGIELRSENDPAAGSITNNLITDCSSAITIYPAAETSEVDASIFNNTLDNNLFHGLGIPVFGPVTPFDPENIVVSIGRNIFSNSGLEAIKDFDGDCEPTIEENAFYNNNDGALDDFDDDLNTGELPAGNIELLYSPYDIEHIAHGRHYLNTFSLGGGALVDAIQGPDLNLGLENKTVFAPVEITRDIVNGHWKKAPVDRAENDIGYHHDRVDYVIGTGKNNYQTDITGQLTIDPGVAISFYRTDADANAKLTVKNGGSVIAEGIPGEFIEFNSVAATGQYFSLPEEGASSYNCGLDISSSAKDNTSIVRYCRFQNADDALRTEMRIAGGIRNCVFQRGGTGVHEVASGNRIVNNLLLNLFDSGLDIEAKAPGSNEPSIVENNTFDGCGNGLSFSGGFPPSVLADINNNLFVSSRANAIIVPVGVILNATLTNNTYWNNAQDIDWEDEEFEVGPTDNTACPMFAFRDDETYPTSDLREYALNQNNGDFSRAPLYISDQYGGGGINGIDHVVLDPHPTGSAPLDGGFEILAGLSEGIPDVNFGGTANDWAGKYTPGSPGTFTPGTQDNGFLWVALRNTGTIGKGAHFTLRFGNDADSELVVTPPERSLNSQEILTLWVARDGSAFFADSSGGTGTANQDALYACRHDPGGPAQSALDIVTGMNEGNDTNTGILVGDPQTVDGRHGLALEFDGNDSVDCDYIDDAVFNDRYALEAWVKPKSPGGTILYRGEGVWWNEGGVLSLVDYKPKFSMGSKAFTLPDPIQSGVWTHLAVTVDTDFATPSERVKFYVDGRLALTGDCPFLGTEVDGTKLGTDSSEYFTGLLDDVRLSIDARDVAALWNSGEYDAPLIADASTVALWNFDGSPAIGRGQAESYDYGTTAADGSLDFQRPDAGFHYFGSRLYDDDGMGIGFSWDGPAESIDGDYSFEMKVVETGPATLIQDWTEIEEDGAFQRTDPSIALADGEYIFTLAAVDTPGGPSLALAEDLVIVDKKAPTGSYLSLWLSEPQDYVDIVQDDLGRAIEIVYGASATEILLQAHFGGEPHPWKVKFDPGFSNTEAAAVDRYPYLYRYRLDPGGAGSEAITATFYDGAGNSEVVTVPVKYHPAFLKESDPPLLEIYRPRPSQTEELVVWDDWISPAPWATLDTYLSFRADDQGGSGIREYSISIEDPPLELVRSPQTQDSSQVFDYRWDTGSVEDGVYVLVFTATDWNGNVSIAKREVEVISGPLASMEISPRGTILLAGDSQNLILTDFRDRNGKVLGASDVADLDIQWNLTFEGTTTEGPGGTTYSFTEDTEGDYDLKATAAQTWAYDSASYSVTEKVQVRVLGADDVATLAIAPKDVILGESKRQQQFTATGADFYGNAVDSPDLIWEVVQGPGTISDVGVYTSPGIVSSGQIAVIRVSDAVNWSAFDTATVTFDFDPPIVYFTQPADEEEVSGLDTMVTWFVDDPAGYSYSLSLDGKVNLAESGGFLSGARTYNTSWDTTMVVNGYHTLMITATDQVGNSRTDTVSVVVQNGAIGSEELIATGLDWLLAHQKVSGYWDEQVDIPGTALAIVSLVESGSTLDFEPDWNFLHSALASIGYASASAPNYATATTRDLAYARMSAPPSVDPATIDIVLANRRIQLQGANEAWWDLSNPGSVDDVETTALVYLASASQDSEAKAYLENMLLNGGSEGITDDEVAVSLFALLRSSQVPDPVAINQGFKTLFSRQQTSGAWSTLESTAWAVLAMVESGDYGDEYPLLSAVDYLGGYAGSLTGKDPQTPFHQTALITWALSRYQETVAGSSTGASGSLLSKRVPGNYVSPQPRGEYAWHNFEDDFTESMVVLNALHLFRDTDKRPEIDRALFGSPGNYSAFQWLRGKSNSQQPDSMEQLARKADVNLEILSIFSLEEFALALVEDVVAAQLPRSTWDDTDVGGYSERISFGGRNASLLESGLAFTLLAGYPQPFENALRFLENARFTDSGWGMGDHVLAPVADVHTTAWTLMAYRELHEREKIGDVEMFRQASEWLASEATFETDTKTSFNSNVVDSALGYLALRGYSGIFDREKVRNYIAGAQEEDWSWNHKPLDTALALMALHYEDSPDLALTELVGDVGSDNSVILTLTIENLSASTLYNGELGVALYDEDPDAEGSTALRIGNIHALSAAEYSPSSATNVVIPLSAFGYQPPPGTKTIFVKIDPLDRVVEEREDNNSQPINLLLLTTTDLVAYEDRIQFAPSPRREKESVTLAGTFLNAGQIIPATPVAYELRLNDSEGPILASSANAATQDSNTYVIDPVFAVYSEGTYPTLLKVDPADDISEPYEDNNLALVDLNVSQNRGLFSSDLELSSEDITFEPSAVEAGQPVLLRLRTENIGSGVATFPQSASGIALRILDNGVQVGGEDFELRHTPDGVRPGDFATFNMPWIFSSGLHEIEFILDPDELGNEDDWLNNRITKTIYVHPPYGGGEVNLGLGVEDLKLSPLPLLEGQSIDLSVTVHNFGGVVANQSLDLNIYESDPQPGNLIATISVDLTAAPLLPGATVGASATIDWDDINSGSPGAYDLYVAIEAPYVTQDTDGRDIQESAAAIYDNTATIRVVVADDEETYPDLLTLSDNLYFPDRVLTVTEEVTFYAILDNEVDGTESVSQILLEDEATRSYLNYWGSFPINNGQRAVVQYKGYLPSGVHLFRITADPSQDVVEADETNNSATASIQIVGSVTPDLAVEHNDFAPGKQNDLRLTLDPADDTVLIHALIHSFADAASKEVPDTVRNIPVRFYHLDGVSNQLLGARTVDLLPGGGEAVVQWDTGLALADVEDTTFAVCVDRNLEDASDSLIAEATDEENNKATINVGTVGPPENLVAVVGKGRADLSWNSPTDASPEDIAAYAVYWETVDQLPLPDLPGLIVAATPAHLTDLEDFVVYRAAVSTISVSGLVSEATWVEFVPMSRPTIVSVNEDAVFPNQPKFVNVGTVNVRVTASPGSYLELYVNGTVFSGGPLLVGASGEARFTDVALETSTSNAVSNIFEAVAANENGDFFSEPSEPINVIYDNLVDLAIYSHDITFRDLDQTEIKPLDLGKYYNKTIQIDARIRNLHGMLVTANMENDVRFEYGDLSSGNTVLIDTVQNVEMDGFGSIIVSAHWSVPDKGDATIDDVTVTVDATDFDPTDVENHYGQLEETTEDNNIATYSFDFGALTHLGTEFWLAFPDTYPRGFEFYLYIFADDTSNTVSLTFNHDIERVTSGELFVDEPEYTESGSMFSDLPTERFLVFKVPTWPEDSSLQISACPACTTSDYTYSQIESKGLHLECDTAVSVIVVLHTEWEEASYSALPSHLLGEEYYIGNYYEASTDDPDDENNSIVVVGTEDDTSVTIHSGTTQLASAVIHEGSTFTYYKIGELTGTRVESDKNVAVISSANESFLPDETTAGDPLMTYLMPHALAGTTYAVAPLQTNSSNPNGVLRIVGENGTQLTIDGANHGSISSGYYELDDGNPHYIEASNPVYVYQFMKGDGETGVGDQNMTIQYPIKKYSTKSSLVLKGTDVGNNSGNANVNITIYAESEEDPQNIEIHNSIDGTDTEITEWTTFSDSSVRFSTEWSCSVDNKNATFTINNPDKLPINAMLNNYGYVGSYGYPVGFQTEYASVDTESGSSDLTITSSDIEIYGNVSPGVSLTVRVDVRNEDVKAATEVLVEIRENDANGMIVGSYIIEEFGGYARDSYFLDFVLDSDTTAIYVAVDPNGTIAESDETNNVAAKTITAPEMLLPDLTVVGPIALSNTSADIGEVIEVAATIENTGDIGVGNFDVSLSNTSGVPGPAQEILYLPSEATAVVVLDFEVGRHGCSTFTVWVDQADVVIESDESTSDNSEQVSITLTAPDLVVSEGPALKESEPPLEVGRPSTLTAKVINAGNTGGCSGTYVQEAVTENFVVSFFNGDPEAGGIEIGRQWLDYDDENPMTATYAQVSGDVAEVSVVWTPTERGLHDIYVVVDAEGGIREAAAPGIVDYEDNNKAMATLNVGSHEPDLWFADPATDIEFYRQPDDIHLDPLVGTTEGAILDVAVTVANQSRHADWVKLGLFDGDPSLASTALIGEAPLGYMAADTSKTVRFPWDTAHKAGKRRINAYVDEPGHLAASSQDDGVPPSTEPLRILNLAFQETDSVTDEALYGEAQYGITLDMLAGTPVIDGTWTIEVWSSTKEFIPDATVGKFVSNNSRTPYGEFIDGATLDAESEILLRFSSEGDSLPQFLPGQTLTLHVASIDSTTTTYEIPVSIPENTEGQYGGQLYLWVAADGSTYFANRYHLRNQFEIQQPLVFTSLHETTEPVLTGYPVVDDLDIYICGSDRLPTAIPAKTDPSTFKGLLEIHDASPPVVFTPGTQQGSDTWLFLSTLNPGTFAQDASLTLTLDTDEEISIDLSGLVFAASESIALWVAQDGGLYHAEESRDWIPNGTPVYGFFDQTFWRSVWGTEDPGANLFIQGMDDRLVGYPNVSATGAMRDTYQGAVAEIVESNNRLEAEFKITKPIYPDFDIATEDITLSHETIEVGQPLTITAQVHNRAADCATPVEVLFYVENVATSATQPITAHPRLLFGLDAGESAELEVEWTPSESGEFHVVVDVDPYNKIIEDASGGDGVYPNSASQELSVTSAPAILTLTTLGDDGYPKGTFSPDELVTIQASVSVTGATGGEPRSFRIRNGALYDDNNFFFDSLPGLQDLTVFQLAPGGTFDGAVENWSSITPGGYVAKAELHDYYLDGNSPIATASATFSIVENASEYPPLLFADVSTDQPVYLLPAGASDPSAVRIQGFLQNQSGVGALEIVEATLSLYRHDILLTVFPQVPIPQIGLDESIDLFEEIRVVDLISGVNYPPGVYEVRLEAFAVAQGVSALATAEFTLDSLLFIGTLDIADPLDGVVEFVASSDALLMSAAWGLPPISTQDWVSVSDRPLRGWFGGGKNLLFNPTLDYDSNGDGTANGWEIAGGAGGLEPRGPEWAQRITGTTPTLSTDDVHDAFVESGRSYSLSFEYQVLSASGSVVVGISEYDDNERLLQALWYRDNGFGSLQVPTTSSWSSSDFERVELNLPPTHPFAKRIKVTFRGIANGAGSDLLIDNVQLETGAIATSWEESEPNNLAINGGFEQWDEPLDYTYYLSDLEQSSSGPEGWQTDALNASYLLDASPVHTGQYSIQIFDVTSEATVLSQQYIEIAPNEDYTVGLRAHHTTGASYELFVSQYDDSKTAVNPSSPISVTSGPPDTFNLHSATLLTATDARYLEVALIGSGGVLWVDSVQVERGTAVSNWVGPISYQAQRDWSLSSGDGTKQADTYFMNRYGKTLEDFAEDLAFDADANGSFDFLLSTSGYEIFGEDLNKPISSFVEESDPPKLFDDDPDLQTAMVLSEATSEINIVMDLGSTYRVDAVSLILVVNVTPELFYSPDNTTWKLADYSTATRSAALLGFQEVDLHNLATPDGAALKERYYRVRLTSSAPSTMETRDLKLRGFRYSSLDTVVLDDTPPTIAIDEPADSDILSTTLAPVSASGVEVNLSHVLIDGVTATWNWLDQESGVYEASAEVLLVEGTNIISATAFDLAGRQSVDSVTVEVDTIPPTILIVSPENGQATGTSPIIVSATGFEPNLDSVDIAGVTTYTVVEGNTYSSTAEVNLISGWNVIEATVTDLAGHVANASIGVYYDDQAPMLEIADPTEGAILPSATFVVIAIAIDDYEISHVTVEDVLANLTDLGEGIYEATAEISIPIVDAWYVVSATAYDVFGLTSSATVSVYVDQTPPSIVIYSPPDDLEAETSSVVVEATGVERNLAQVTIAGVTVPWVSLGGDVFAASRSVDLLPGTNVIVAIAEDILGATGSDTITVRYDSEPPTPNDEIFDDASFVLNHWNSLSVNLVLDATDNLTIRDAIEVSLVGDVTPEIGSFIPLASAPVTILLDPSSDGLKSATAQYRDEAGNLSALVFDDVTLDRTAPTVKPIKPATDAIESGTYDLKFTGDEFGVGLGIDPWDYRFEGSEVTDWDSLSNLPTYHYTVVDGHYAAYAKDDSTKRPDGPYSLFYRATDRLGNAATGERPFIIDNDKPPAAPTNLLAIADCTDTIHLLWEPNTEIDLAGYRIYRATESGGSYSLVGEVDDATSYDDVDSATNDIWGATQYYVLTAFDGADNESEWLYEAQANLDTPTAPDAPSQLQAFSGDGFVKLFWAADLNPQLVNYWIYRKTEGGSYGASLNSSAIVATTPEVYYQDDTVTNGVTYYYYVEAYYNDNPCTASPSSNEVEAHPATGAIQRSFGLTFAGEDQRNNSFSDWDYNDFVIFVTGTEELTDSGGEADVLSLSLSMELMQQITRANYSGEVRLEVEILSGTAEFNVTRVGDTPASSDYLFSSPGVVNLLLLKVNSGGADVGDTATLSITSKSTDLEMKYWLPYFSIPSIGNIYPTWHGHHENQSQVANIYGGSPLQGVYLDYVVVIEDASPVLFSPYDGEQHVGNEWLNNADGNIWKYYPDFVNFILHGDKHYWYRNPSE